jgi:hypothetical protein
VWLRRLARVPGTGQAWGSRPAMHALPHELAGRPFSASPGRRLEALPCRIVVGAWGEPFCVRAFPMGLARQGRFSICALHRTEAERARCGCAVLTSETLT